MKASNCGNRATVAPIFMKQAQVQLQQQEEERISLEVAFIRTGVATFVSTSMRVVNLDADYADVELIFVGKIPYYRLTPLFWAWLRHAFGFAVKACEAGKLDGTTFLEMLERMSSIYNTALSQYGEATIKEAERTFTPAKWKRHCERLSQGVKHIISESNTNADSSTCVPTGTHRYPEDAVGVCHKVSKTAVALVDEINDSAIGSGWSMNQLYRNVGIAHRDWGLVCYLGPTDSIGKITKQSIEIVHVSPSGFSSLYFYNVKVEQPWLRMKSPEVTD